jgi:hypothetical protein
MTQESRHDGLFEPPGCRHWFAEVWWSLVERAVRAVTVVVVDVGREDSFEVAAVEDQENDLTQEVCGGEAVHP